MLVQPQISQSHDRKKQNHVRKESNFKTKFRLSQNLFVDVGDNEYQTICFSWNFLFFMSTSKEKRIKYNNVPISVHCDYADVHTKYNIFICVICQLYSCP